MVDLVDAPLNEAPADEVWVWVSVDNRGEGIVAFSTGPMGGMSLITAKRSLLPKLRDYALMTARRTGARLRLVRFTRAEVVEEIGG